MLSECKEEKLKYWTFGKTDNMNQELQKMLTERSIVSIKGKKRSASYKKIMNKLLAAVKYHAAEESRTDKELDLHWNRGCRCGKKWNRRRSAGTLFDFRKEWRIRRHERF